MFDPLFSETGLSLERLRILAEIHHAGGIAKAAPGDPVRQSQYSRQLRELSEFFGTEIARRQGRVLKLTEPGVRLAEMVRAQMHALQDFRAECRAEKVSYTIAGGDGLLQWLVIPRLMKISRADQSAHIATSNLRTNEIVQQLGDGRVDFGVMRKDALAEPLKSARLGTLKFAAVVPRELLPAKGPVSLGDVLGRLPLATQNGDSQFTQRLREIAREHQTELQPTLICQSFPQALAAVRSGGYGSVQPVLALEELKADAYRVIKDGPLDRLDRDIIIAWNPRLLRVRTGSKHLLEKLQNVLAF